jgi:hypothetical protein
VLNQNVVTFEQLPLWKHFKGLNSAKAVANVEQLLLDAGGMLDRIVETFPTYTLHNSTHASNVARLMGELLGDSGLKKITALEAGMLLLSAYLHDIGMLFHKNEINDLTKQPEWDEFLNRHPEAFIAAKNTRKIPIEIIEWYCRSLHANRVFSYVNSFPRELLKWGAIFIGNDLGQLCKSHNSPAKDLLNLETHYLGECDLRFCAILLRLADILDFDGSRSPEMVYRFLELRRRNNFRDAQSDTEWRKHLASNGFRFPIARTVGFELTIAAGPDTPAVEHDLRRFLDVIDDELQACRSVLTTCSDRWQNFTLPRAIDRRGVKSDGYKYGAYRFTLQQDQILDLLMGENLYEDPYVFVRELLQNAIDTSRHREFLERASGNSAFRATPINVSEWDDSEGRRWVRFDDYGVGMNEQIIEEFLLKVGRSYYASPQFKAELIKVRKKIPHDFLPISRFGIGLLSCFLVGDRVEIFSVRRTEQGKRDQPIRLSLNGLHGFYTLQTLPLALDLMPSVKGDETPSAGRDFGTSIAVRLDPRREQGVFNLKSELERHLFCPPVQVAFNGDLVGGCPELVEKPGIKRHQIRIEKERLHTFEERLGYKFRQPIIVEFAPLDLTRNSPNANLRGQLVIARYIPSKEWKRLSAVPDTLNLTSGINCHDGKVTLRLEAESGDCVNCKNRTIRKIAQHIESESDKRDPSHAYAWIDISDLAEKTLRVPNVLGQSPKWLVHNGIVVPTRIPDRGSEDLDWADRLLWFNSATLLATEGMWGVVCLADSLRPNVSVSRDVLVNLPVQVHSAIALAAFRARRKADFIPNTRPSDVLNHFTAPDGVLLGSLLADPLVVSKNGWQTEPVFKTARGRMTLKNVQQTLNKGVKALHLKNLHSPARLAGSEFSGFIDACTAALAQIGLRIEFQPIMFGGEFVAVPGQPVPVQPGHKLFPPLTFLPFKGNKTAIRDGVLNTNHPFPKWLLRSAPKLQEKYPGILRSIREAVADGSFQRINRNLQRLLALHVDLRPPKSAFLSEADSSEKGRQPLNG